MSRDTIKTFSHWLQIAASICAIIAFGWEYQRHKKEAAKSETTT